ncbi:hypothetical protein JTB14_020376 [Gonioctena quinquepunctata]|nr:hypothetical protein JTB14_020376 [Gonioctena quinquepunctata]
MIIANTIRNNTQEEDYFLLAVRKVKRTILVEDSILRNIENFLTILLTRVDEERREHAPKTAGEQYDDNEEKLKINLFNLLRILKRVDYSSNKDVLK